MRWGHDRGAVDPQPKLQAEDSRTERDGISTCTACDRLFRYAVPDDQPIPTCCGALHCRAHVEWDDERWAGAADMARARERAGIHLTDLDRQALGRTP